MDVGFAPAGRLSVEASRVVVDWILGGGVLFLALGAALLALFAWSRARRLSAEVWHRHGLRAGPILLTGTAHRADDDTDARGFIELTITQAGREYRSKNGHYVAWTEQGRALVERPFLLKTDGGDVVRVVPGGRVELVDRLEPAVVTGPATRTRTARVVEGERVWLRGELRREGGEPAGPYRGDGSARWTLRPPARRALFVSSEPVDVEDRVTARRHARFALAFLALLAFAQGSIFSSFRSLRAHAVRTHGQIITKRSWRVHTKNGYAYHYAWDVRYDAPGGPYLETEEVNPSAFVANSEGTWVPVNYSSVEPSVMQVGDVGVSLWAVLTAGLLGFSLLAIYFAIVGRRPWWRQRRVVDHVTGSL